jgi:hypothetical protein
MKVMTVSRAYLKQMRADQEYRRRKAELEQSGDTELLRLLEIQRRYEDPEDPMRLFGAQITEILRRHLLSLDLCEDCRAKVPDPLAD